MHTHLGDMEEATGADLPPPPPEGPSATGEPPETGRFTARFQEASRTLWVIAAAVLGRRTDVEDVLQEAAIIGLRKMSDFQEGTSFAAWMGGIVRNVARNHARKRRRRQTSESDPRTLDLVQTARPQAQAVPGFDRQGHLGVDQGVFDDRVLRALNTLEETARACLLLRTLREMSYREISLLLGIPEGTAMSHVHRARMAMRSILGAPGE